MKKIFLISIIFLTFSCVNLGTLKSNYGSGDLVFPKLKKERFLNYISGEYFSKEFDRQEDQKNPIVFAISKDGTKSLILMCDETVGGDCGSRIYILQTLSRYSKKLGSKLYIFAIKNKIVWNNANKYIQNPEDFNKYLKDSKIISTNLISKTKIIFYDELFYMDNTSDCDEQGC